MTDATNLESELALRDDMLTRACITVAGLDEDGRHYTVADYDAVQRQRELRPLWARKTPPVEHLTNIPAIPYGAHITDHAAYDAQMRVLIGLDEPPLSTSTAAG